VAISLFTISRIIPPALSDPLRVRVIYLGRCPLAVCRRKLWINHLLPRFDSNTSVIQLPIALFQRKVILSRRSIVSFYRPVRQHAISHSLNARQLLDIEYLLRNFSTLRSLSYCAIHETVDIRFSNKEPTRSLLPDTIGPASSV
jgi:hypothetical protein